MTDVAVIFPTTHHGGGVERVAWDLMDYLGPRHDTAFIGSSAPNGVPEHVSYLPVRVPERPGVLRPWRFRRAAAAQVRASRPEVTVTLGILGPIRDVLWIHSVHRAWLQSAREVRLGRWRAPARLRYALPRHQSLLRLERDQLLHAHPRRIICTSQREVADLERLYGIDPSITSVVPNGFDPRTFNIGRKAATGAEARAALGVADGQLAMLFVANELRRKGFEQTLRAMAKVADERLTLHVLGRASLTPFRHLITALGLDRQVKHHGPAADVGWWLSGADLMVLPTQYEPFGLVIIEALASGVPVITTRLAGAAGAVQPAKTGLLLDDPYDVEGLAELLRAAASSDLHAMGEAAAGSVGDYQRDAVMAQAERVIFS